MGKIFYLMGKSSSGKDTIFKELKKRMTFLHTVKIYTTRPMREQERDGEEYFFVGEDTLENFQRAGRVIELREYDTVHGIWKYFTADDGRIRLNEEDYLMIGTLESYEKLCGYFGQKRIVPIYVEVEDGERLSRALMRERLQEEPKYAEMCRRFLADTIDFSEVNLKRCGIDRRFQNVVLEECIQEIMLYIQNYL